MSVGGHGFAGPDPVCGRTCLLRVRNALTSVVPSVDRPPRSPALLVGRMCLLTRQVVVARSDHHPDHWRSQPRGGRPSARRYWAKGFLSRYIGRLRGGWPIGELFSATDHL